MLEYREASNAIEPLGNYKSPDYYRTELDSSVPLFISDHPSHIFLDMSFHDDTAIQKLEWAMGRGLVERKEIPNTESFFFDCIPPEDAGKGSDPLYVRHRAMMLAFPERYIAVFGDDLPWDYNDRRLTEFVGTCYMEYQACKSWSEYVATVAVPEKKKGPGRPRKPTPDKDVKASGHKAWLEACRVHKEWVAEAWRAYVEACQTRKQQRKEAQAWREEALAQVENQYRTKLTELDDFVANQFRVHAEAKATPKPRKDDF